MVPSGVTSCLEVNQRVERSLSTLLRNANDAEFVLVYYLVIFVKATQQLYSSWCCLPQGRVSVPLAWLMFLVSPSMPKAFRTSGPRLCKPPKR